MDFGGISGCETHFKSELRPKPIEIDKDKLRMKFSEFMERRFHRPKSRFFRFKETYVRGHQIAVPP